MKLLQSTSILGLRLLEGTAGPAVTCEDCAYFRPRTRTGAVVVLGASSTSIWLMPRYESQSTQPSVTAAAHAVASAFRFMAQKMC